MGYARSKLVGEKIVQAAVEQGARATVLRIGQVVGSKEQRGWNENEMVPLIVRSAITMGMLPELEMTCRWLPVDVLATTILDLAGLSSPAMKDSKEQHVDASVPNDVLAAKEQSKFLSTLPGVKEHLDGSVSNSISAAKEGPEPLSALLEIEKDHGDETAPNEISTANEELGSSPASSNLQQHLVNHAPDGLNPPKEDQFVYNVLSPHRFRFTHFLTALSNTALHPFTPVPTPVWLSRLRHLSQSATTITNPNTNDADANNPDLVADPKQNPALKLVDYFENALGGMVDVEVEFEMGKAIEKSQGLRECGSVLEEGGVERMVACWMGQWGLGKEKGEKFADETEGEELATAEGQAVDKVEDREKKEEGNGK